MSHAVIPVTEINQRLQIARILWAAFLFTSVVFSFVLLSMQAAAPAESEPLNLKHLQLMAALGALNILVLAPIVSRMSLNPAKLEARADLATKDKVYAVFFSANLVRMVICESGLILGFVAAFSSHDLNWYYGLCALFVIGMLAGFPKLDQLRELLTRKGFAIR